MELVHTKGQLISKRLFGILNSSKQRTRKFDLTSMIHQVDFFSFVFGDTTKKMEEIQNVITIESKSK